MTLYMRKVGSNEYTTVGKVTSSIEADELVSSHALSQGLVVKYTYANEEKICNVNWDTGDIEVDFKTISQDWRAEDISGDSYYYYAQYCA